MKLNERIRQLRNEHNLTHAALSRRTGLSLALLSMHENRKRTISVEQLIVYAKAYMMTVQDLIAPVSFDDSAPLPFDPEQDMIDKHFDHQFEVEIDRSELRDYFKAEKP